MKATAFASLLKRITSLLTRFSSKSSFRLASRLIAFLFFLSLWLAPMTWVGLTNRSIPGAGVYLNYMWRVAALFPRRSRWWDNYFFEVRLDGDSLWREVPDSDLGTMRPFGAGTRLHRIMAQGGGDSNRAEVLRSVALYIKGRHEHLHPDLPPVSEVRFVRQRFPVGSPETARNPGPWMIPKLEEVPPEQRTIWRHYRFSAEAGFSSSLRGSIP